MLLFMAFLMVLVAIVLFILGTKRVQDGEKTYTFHLSRYGLVALLFAFVFLGFKSITTVAPGEVGVPVTFGTAGSSLGSGLHLINPFTNVHTVSVQNQVYVLVANPSEGTPGDDSVEVRGSDQATGRVNARLTYHQTAGNATSVYKRYGTDIETRVVRPALRSCLNDAAINHTLAENASTKRAAFEQDASDCIERKFTRAGIEFDDLAVAEITLPEDVQAAVNARAASFSQLEATQNEAQGARIEALGQSDSQQIIRCGGVADRLDNGTTTITPNTNDDGSCAGPSRLSADYLQYLYIQALNTNAGSENHTLFVVPPGTDLNALVNTGPAGG